ncbi:zinc-dependent metalloprotease [Piscinibacter sp.]|uniref:zinc-dependent metalloprotease n=1 Tax=Piscinibacter sp. TaxID=1903157 RepID=UPI002F4273A9
MSATFTPAVKPATAASAPRTTPASIAAARAAASGLRPFADVVKDATRIDGLFTLWQKDDKVWIELKPGDFGQPFFLSPKAKTGIGEGSFYGGLMGDEVVVEFRRIHNQVQMLARNTEYVAQADTPTGRAVQAAFSPSLLASTGVLSQPQPERNSVLVEANALFVNDMLGTGMQLQRAYRQSYSLDPRNSAITAVRATPELVVLEVLNHFATGSISPSGGSSVPRTLADPRSLFMTFHYSLARLPEQTMPARKADGRVGHFTSSITDFTDDLARSPRQRFVNRWRLEKKDPALTLSEPVKPITFWLDRSIPEKYRAPITAGVLEWNKAFEQIGFKDAIRVELQPADADWDTLDFGRASIRWMTNASPSFGAIGPSHVDPRSGEILDADIGIESLSSRNQRALRSQVLAKPVAGDDGHAHEAAGLRGSRAAWCDFADQAAEQLGYALDVLDARGDIDPAGPDAEKFVYDYLKDVTMHEVGHTLGLRHNFRSSRVYTERQLADPVFTATHGLTGSVMEYAPINLAAPGVPREQQAAPFNTTLGPYDYWAIEYAYKPLPSATEDAELATIAGRSNEPLLAYGTDEDNFLGVDPESLQFDLGSDAVAFARKRVAIAQDLLQRQETRQLQPDQDYAVLRRSVAYALRDMGRAANVLTRQIGGVRTLRDHAGSGRDPLLPVPAVEQRAALAVLASGFLSADSFVISPKLQRKLVLDYQERTDAVFRGEALGATDFSLASQVIELQRGVLGQLLSDGVAARLLDSESKSPKDALRLSELYGRLDNSVWSELAAGGDVPALRRELQREHVNRLAAMLLRPASLSRADARSLVRAQAQGLLARINAASKRGHLSAEAKAHLQDSADTLAQALAAKLVRAGA